uniref:Putative conserved plasma membrane protein n=1 Tax=Ixodes ricinus TaxID=34613 RepID=A0A131XQZ0_IXORI
MPVNQVELLYFLCRLADDANLRVAVNNYLKGGLITGGSAIFGALLLGPLGFLVGGVLGGFTAFLATQDKFMPVSEIIDRMSEREKDELYKAINRAFSDVDIPDVAKLEALIYGNLDMKEMMIAALMDNIEKGMLNKTN